MGAEAHVYLIYYSTKEQILTPEELRAILVQKHLLASTKVQILTAEEVFPANLFLSREGVVKLGM